MATADGRIFISYRRQETAWPARQLYEALCERFGVSQVFKDVDNIAPGEDFVERISSTVESCQVLLAMIGPQWLKVADEDGNRRIDDPDDFVRLEVGTALSRGVLVVPILVDGARLPKAVELPADLAPITRRQAIEINPTGFNLDRLFQALDDALSRAAEEEAAAVAPEPAPPTPEPAPLPAPVPEPVPAPVTEPAAPPEPVVAAAETAAVTEPVAEQPAPVPEPQPPASGQAVVAPATPEPMAPPEPMASPEPMVPPPGPIPGPAASEQVVERGEPAPARAAVPPTTPETVSVPPDPAPVAPETAGVPPDPAPVAPETAGVPPDPAPVAPELAGVPPAPPAPPDQPPPDQPPPARPLPAAAAPSRSRLPLVVAGIAVLAVIGAAAGWAVFGNPPPAPSPSPSASPSPSPSVLEPVAETIVVDKATVRTGIECTAGRVLSLTASGQLTADNRKAGPDGAAGRFDKAAPLPTAPVGALVGTVGQDWFFVGDTLTLVCPAGGELELGTNTVEGAGLSGSLTAEIISRDDLAAADLGIVTIVLPATASWLDSGFDCTADEEFRVSATGIASAKGAAASAAGGADGVRPKDGKLVPGQVVRTAAHRALIGRVDDGDPFLLGSSATIACPAEGPLELQVNDGVLNDNTGEFAVVLSRWPQE